MILKTIIAGPLRQQVLYSNIAVREDDNLEELRLKHAIRRSYDRWMRNKTRALQALILLNFDNSAWYATLTFDDEHLPPDRALVARRYTYFVQKLRACGCNSVHYLKSMEHRHGIGRWHIHLIINGCTKQQIKECWIYGSVRKLQPLDIRRVVPHGTKQGLAAYLIKEIPDKMGQRSFQCSTGKNKLLHPEIIRQIVPNNYVLDAPIGCTVIRREPVAENALGSVSSISYFVE